MENFRIKEILELAIDKLNNSEFGICHALGLLKYYGEIVESENVFIKQYLNENKPSTENQYHEFTENKFWNDKASPNFWWTEISYAPETRQIRKDYLTALFNNIE